MPANLAQALKLPREFGPGDPRELKVEVLRNMQFTTAKKLVQVTDGLMKVEGPARNKMDLSRLHTQTALQLVAINTLMASLKISKSVNPKMPPSEGLTEDLHAEPTASTPLTTSRSSGAFRDVQWESIQTFTPTAEVQQHIDSVIQAQADTNNGQPILGPLPVDHAQNRYPDITMPHFMPSSFSGMFALFPPPSEL